MQRSVHSAPKLVSLALFVLAGGVAVWPAISFGQQLQVEEIVVTARKREESLQDIPVSIVALSGDELVKQGLNDLQDIAKVVPGLTFDQKVGQNDLRPAIRGLQAEQGRTSVGLLIDDIDVTSENLQIAGGGTLARLRLLDVERVEVVKGPQAALYGRSAFGGAVNFITKRPDLEATELSAVIEGHSESGYQLKLSAGTPLANDRVAMRLNAYYWDEQGSYRNNFSGDYVGGGQGAGLAASILARPSDAVTIYGRLEYSDDEYDPQAAFVLNGNTVVNLTPEAQQVLGVPTTTIFTGLVSDTPIRYDIDPRTGRDYQGFDAQITRGSLIVDWDLGDMALKSLTSVVDAEDYAFQDNDFVSGSVGGIVTGAFQETERLNETKQISQEVRLYSQNDSPLQWMVGGLYWSEDVDQFGSNDTGLAFGPIFDSDVSAFYFARDGSGRGVARDTEHWSAFGWMEYAFNERWSASAEARYTEEDIDYFLDFDPPFEFFFGVISTGGQTPPVLLPLGVVSGTDFARVTEKYVVPKFTLEYQPTDELNFYASAGKGIKPSGFQSGAIFELNIPYDREKLWSYEIGSKMRLADGRLALNTALFFQDYTDQQVSSQIFNTEAQQLQAVIENAGKSSILGFELEGTWRATERLTFSGGYTYIDAEFDEFRVVSTSASRIGESGCGEFLTFGDAPPACLLIKDGNTPADLPRNQITLLGNYTAPLTGDWEWFAEANSRYTGKRYLSTANVAFFDSYWITDVRLGVQNDRVRATLFADNVFDDDTVNQGLLYVDFFNSFAPSAFGYRPDPFRVGLRVSVNL